MTIILLESEFTDISMVIRDAAFEYIGAETDNKAFAFICFRTDFPTYC